MSTSGIIASNGKIYDNLLPNPYPYPAQAPPLAQVLIAGDDAGNGNIENLLQLQATNVVQQAQIGGHLTIGGTPSAPGSGGDLRIQGATAKGSLLAGNATSTVEVPLGTNGYVLTADNTEVAGVKWAAAGGAGVASITAGSNIGVSNAIPTAPVVSLLSPLTSTLNLGSQNTTGTTGALTFDDTVSNSKGVLGAISLILSDSTFSTGDQTQTNKSGYSAIGSTDTTTHTKTGLSKTAGATDLTISNSVAAQNIALNTTSGIITTNCSIKPTAITDSASATGTSGQVLTAGTGGQLLWGSNGVSSITAGSNIGITGTASVPVVGLLNPLTSTLNLGTQSITGTTSNITLSSGSNQANVNGNLGFTSASQITPTTKANLFNTSISVETSTNKVIIQPTSILKSVGSATFSVGTVGSAPLSLIGAGGNADGVQITQVPGATTLITTLSNVKYYPDMYISNGNASTVAVPLPQVDYQRLTLNNLGLTDTNSWNNYGNAIFSPSGFEAFFIDSNNNVWLAETGTGNIRVCDNPPVNILHNITMVNGSSAPVAVNVFYEQGGYVFIGGTFTSINGNATPQYNITRVLLSSYMEDPMGDTLTPVYGTGVNYAVYGITDVNGALAFCGNFTNLSSGANAYYICEIANPYVPGTNQTYTEMLGGVNAQVFAIFYNSNRVFFGGDFTSVDNSSPIGYAYGAYYDYNTSAWLDVANNSLNGRVEIIKPTAYGYIFLGGSFTAPQTSPYSCYIEEGTPQNSADTSLVSTNPLTYKHAHGVGATLGVYTASSGTLRVSSNFQTWVDLGNPGSGSIVNGVNFWSGNFKVIYDNYEYVRSHATLPHSCIFTGSFIYDAVPYGNYTITTRNVSQQFIGDDNQTYWSIIGQGVGTFS